MDRISGDALTVLKQLVDNDYPEDNLPEGATYSMLCYLAAIGYASMQTWQPPKPDSPYRDEQDGLSGFAITEKGREYIRLQAEAASEQSRKETEQRKKDVAHHQQLHQQHTSPNTQQIKDKSFGAHLLLTSSLPLSLPK